MKQIKKGLLFIVITFIMVMNVSASETLQSLIDSGETTIVLDNNYTEDITISKKQNVTIDLNGYTLTITDGLDVLGTLTVKSSKDGGQIIKPGGNYNNAIIYVGDSDTKTAGKFVLESGKVISQKGFGVACFAGGTAIINGGEIDAVYSALSGNNTLGTMNFVVNGGTLNAGDGPAIYMPGPVSLTITGGTFNGGLSLRMGKVNISGGIINAATKNFDPLVKYYNYSGNAWLPDALYVWGGTYSAKDEGETNILDLNVTGGTFNTANGLGSAIAIYDMGKVAQEMKVNISGTAKLITNSTTRNAFDILSLPEAEVTKYDNGYNNPEYVGKVSAIITGGTYSSSMAKYITNEYVETNINNEFIVAKKEVKVDTPTIDPTKPVDEIKVGVKEDDSLKDILVKAIKDSKIDVADINAVVIVTIDSEKEKEVPAEATQSINELAKEKGNVKVASFFDITLNVKNNITGEALGTLNTLNKKIKFEMSLPSELTKLEEGYTRKYYIVRYHDGKSEIIPASVEGNMLSFESDKFSTYALAYEGVKNETITNPPTADRIVMDLIIGVISIVGLAAISNNAAKRKKYFN